jgi:hypothetical protein
MRFEFSDESPYSIFRGAGMAFYSPGRVKFSEEKVDVYVSFEIYSHDRAIAG